MKRSPSLAAFTDVVNDAAAPTRVVVEPPALAVKIVVEPDATKSSASVSLPERNLSIQPNSGLDNKCVTISNQPPAVVIEFHQKLREVKRQMHLHLLHLLIVLPFL